MEELTYLTFERYKELGGTLDETTFNFLYSKAKYTIDKYTFKRITKISNAIELCMRDLIGAINEDKTGITSESANGYSVSYNVETNVIEDIISLYLSNEVAEGGTPLLYRGV